MRFLSLPPPRNDLTVNTIMADPLTILTTLPSALEAIRVLCKFLDAARKHDKIIGSLFEEVQDLEGTLIDLQNAVAGAANNSAFKKIESLLRRCAEKCKNFSTLIEKCTIHSSASKSSFRDALRLKYKEDEVMEFKQTLNSLKLTIDMALHAVTW
jgi:Fungal N-terminal domain of STAND proteins